MKKPTKQKAPKRRPAKRVSKPTKPSTALARRRPAPPPARVEVLPPEHEQRMIPADGMNLGALGLVEVKLTEQEERILAEPVNEALIRWKPQKKGPPLPYLPHAAYTKWFNRAFGRLGWALVPIGKPAMAGGSVICPYVLHIHGQPVAFAQGEQDYFENNKQQSYGDALESTVASGLRRCAKRMGVSSELWDRDYVDDLRRRLGIRWAKPEDDDDAPAPPRTYQERARGPVEADRAPSAGYNAKADQPITDGSREKPGQRQRLWVIMKRSGRSETEVKMWLAARFGYQSTKDIKRRDYDFICKALEHPGDLPLLTDDREPGAEG